MAKLYPRLETFEYEEKITEVETQIRKNGKYIYTPSDADLQWLPIGDRIDISKLKKLRQNIISFVKAFFQEKQKLIATDLTKFDRELGLKLLEWMNITPSIAADTGMWAYLNIMLVPDVIRWRWRDRNGKVDHARFYSQSRNYLGILWLSAYLCDDENIYRNINSDWFIAWFEKSETRGLPNYIDLLYTTIEPRLREIDLDKIGEKESKDVFRGIMNVFKKKLSCINYFAIDENTFTKIANDSVSDWIKTKTTGV